MPNPACPPGPILAAWRSCASPSHTASCRRPMQTSDSAIRNARSGRGRGPRKEQGRAAFPDRHMGGPGRAHAGGGSQAARPTRRRTPSRISGGGSKQSNARLACPVIRLAGRASQARPAQAMPVPAISQGFARGAQNSRIKAAHDERLGGRQPSVACAPFCLPSILTRQSRTRRLLQDTSCLGSMFDHAMFPRAERFP